MKNLLNCAFVSHSGTEFINNFKMARRDINGERVTKDPIIPLGKNWNRLIDETHDSCRQKC